MKRLKGWMLGWLIILLAVFPLTGCFNQDVTIDPTKQITEYTKPAVVRVVSYNALTYQLDSQLAAYLGIEQQVTVYEGGTGSGAILTSDGYIVTNAHVIAAAKFEGSEAENRIHEVFLREILTLIMQTDPYHRDELYARVRETTRFSNLERVHKVVLPGGDVYSFTVKTAGKAIGEGKDVAILKIDGNNLPTVMIDETDQAQTSDEVVIAGYPGKADLDGLLDESSALVSTYTSGKIAARKNSKGGPLLQLDANVNPGNSGGPVFNMEGKMIGIATATSRDGIGWAVASSTVLEFTKQAGISVNQPNSINDKWQEGLTWYWQGHYSKALVKFEEVKRLHPQNYDIDSYITRSQKAIDEGKDKFYWKDYIPFL